MNNNRTFAGGYQPRPLPPGTTIQPPPKDPACLANPVNAAESASSTTSTSQESGQNEPSGDRFGNRVSFNFQPEESERTKAQMSAVQKMSPFERILLERVESLITLQSEGNSLLLALIEAMGQDPDPNDFHEPGHL